jgi:hypothetical protein
MTTHKKATYNPATDKIEITGEEEIPGAIYYNKAGFNKEESVHNDGENYLRILPGSSDKKYFGHNKEGEKAEDIYEMEVNLPAIGNMVAEGWDFIYGGGREGVADDDKTSLYDIRELFKDQYNYFMDILNPTNNAEVIPVILTKTDAYGNKYRICVGSTIDGDDKWIDVVLIPGEVDEEGNISKFGTIDISHKTIDLFNSEEIVTTSAPREFINYKYEFDEAGHLTKEISQKLQLLSLNDDESDWFERDD